MMPSETQRLAVADRPREAVQSKLFDMIFKHRLPLAVQQCVYF